MEHTIPGYGGSVVLRYIGGPRTRKGRERFDQQPNWVRRWRLAAYSGATHTECAGQAILANGELWIVTPRVGHIGTKKLGTEPIRRRCGLTTHTRWIKTLVPNESNSEGPECRRGEPNYLKPKTIGYGAGRHKKTGDRYRYRY